MPDRHYPICHSCGDVKHEVTEFHCYRCGQPAHSGTEPVRCDECMHLPDEGGG